MVRSEGKRIFWITELVLDKDIQRTSQLEIMTSLGERGNDVCLHGICSKKPFRWRETNVRICCLPMREVPLIQALLLGIGRFLFLPMYLMVKRPTYIIVGPGLSVLALIWKPLLSFCTRSKVILDVRSPPVEVEGILASLRAVIFSVSITIAKRAFDGMTVLTNAMRKTISVKHAIPPRWIGVVTSGVSTSLFEPSRFSFEGAQLRQKSNLVGKFVVLYHGAATAHRGLIESVESMEIVARMHDDVVLFLLVNGPMVPKIKELVRSRRLQDNVIVHEVVDYPDVPKYISMCDVGLVPLPRIPDWIDQCPLNLLEYLAMEKPAVLVDIAANRTIVGESECGIYVRAAEPAEIAEGILYARDEKAKLRQWGVCGRALVKERYDWGIIAGELENYLESCARYKQGSIER